MATKTINRSPPTAPVSGRRYKDDLFGWVEDQVALLKSGQLSEIDAVNIADELSDVGNEQYDKLESAIRIVLLHLLKWDQQPERRSRSWVLSIKIQRRHIARVLSKNPSLKPHIADAIDEAYDDARDIAQAETGLPDGSFAVRCPFDWTAILNRVVAFDETRSPES